MLFPYSANLLAIKAYNFVLKHDVPVSFTNVTISIIQLDDYDIITAIEFIEPDDYPVMSFSINGFNVSNDIISNKNKSKITFVTPLCGIVLPNNTIPNWERRTIKIYAICLPESLKNKITKHFIKCVQPDTPSISPVSEPFEIYDGRFFEYTKGGSLSLHF